MKFKAPKDSFKKTVGYIHGITNESVMLMSAHQEAGVLMLEGASTSAYVRVTTTADVLAPGIVAVDAQHLASVKYPSDVVVSYENQRVVVNSAQLKFDVPTQQGGGFVKSLRPDIKEQKWIRIPKNILLKAVQASVFEFALKSAADGVCLKLGPTGIIMHAIDTVRASLYVAPLEEQPEQPIQVVLSTKFFDALRKIPSNEDHILIGVDGGSFRVKTDLAILAYPQMQIEPIDVYENTQNMLKDATLEGRAVLSSKRLASSVATVTSVVRGGIDLEDRIKISVNKDACSMTLSMDTKFGNIVEVVPIGEDAINCEFLLSVKYLTDFLPLMQDDVTIKYYNGTSVMFESDNGRSTLLIQAATM